MSVMSVNDYLCRIPGVDPGQSSRKLAGMAPKFAMVTTGMF